MPLHNPPHGSPPCTPILPPTAASDTISLLDSEQATPLVKKLRASQYMRAQRATSTASKLLLALSVLTALWLALLATVAFKSTDPVVLHFPAACPADKLEGCSRVADQQAHRNFDHIGVHLEASQAAILELVSAWVQAYPRTAVLYEDRAEGFIHARFVSKLWGFADDVFFSARCNGDMAVVEVQGQLRVGQGDMEVNVLRNMQFLEHLKGAVDSGALPLAACHSKAH